MNQTKSELRKYKGIPLRVTKHWSGSTTAIVIFNGEGYHFDTIKQAKSFICSITGK